MGPKYLIIGAGKTATHLSHYFDLLKISHRTWSRKSTDSLPSLLTSQPTILLAVSDRAIAEFVKQNLAAYPGRVVHFSGAHEFPGTISMHPLISFGPTLFNLDFYQRIPFILTQGQLQDFIPELQNPSWIIQPEQKAYYHALCVISGNFTTLLWQKMFLGLEELNLPTSLAYPYLQSIAQNLLNSSSQALTGPLARKDQNTVQSNLTALEKDPFQAVYLAFQKIFFPEFQFQQGNHHENPRL